jgi:hypothetical protein
LKPPLAIQTVPPVFPRVLAPTAGRSGLPGCGSDDVPRVGDDSTLQRFRISRWRNPLASPAASVNRGYRTDSPEALESHLRAQRLALDATRKSQNEYGVAYEIDGPITTPGGRVVRFRSIWQIDTGTDVPRFITMYPR